MARVARVVVPGAPHHVHLVGVPASADGLRGAIGTVRRGYSRHVRFREGWRGHLSQGRFASLPMGEAHTLEAARDAELNPVRARLLAAPAYRRGRASTPTASPTQFTPSAVRCAARGDRSRRAREP